jgi:hypothetical protein
MSFGQRSQTQQTSFNNQQDPWDVTIPYLTRYLEQLGQVGDQPQGATPAQQQAFDQLGQNAQAGNPNAGAIMSLANDQLATPDNTGMVRDGYADLTRRLSPTADGGNLDLSSNTYLQQVLNQQATDAQDRVNASFAAAGRDFSGANQEAVGRGVTAAQAPLLLDMFRSEQQRTDAAARDLFNASGSTAGQISQLDRARSDLRSQGIDTTNAALAARDQGANTVLQLEQQQRMLPLGNLAALAQLLYPAAQLGGQSTGNGTSQSNRSGWSVGIGDIGRFATGIGTMFR